MKGRRRSSTLTITEHLTDVLVRMPNGCLEWQGCNIRGYGRIWFNGKMAYTHRLTWTLANGPIPPGMYICHKCDNPPCCDLTHLFLGTPAENHGDMMAKGRHGHAGAEKRTHCPRGHEYDEANTYKWSGKRGCRACHKASEQQRRAKRLVAMA